MARSPSSTLKKKMEAGRDAIGDLHFKQHRGIEFIKGLAGTRNLDATQQKTAKSYLSGIVAGAKNGRGSLKTLGTQLDGLRKRGEAAGPGWKSMAAKSVAASEKPFKEAIKASEAFDKEEKDCTKLCNDRGVRL